MTTAFVNVYGIKLIFENLGFGSRDLFDCLLYCLKDLFYLYIVTV